MSCIQRILDVKGDKDYLIFGGESAVEGGGNYRGYDYMVTVRYHGCRCGYVAISSDHPFSQYDDYFELPDLSVHGGITFYDKSGSLDGIELILDEHICDDKWVGFDASHYCDKSDYELARRIFADPEVIDYINRREQYSIKSVDSRHRTYEYMENECKKLIDQLIAHEENHKMVGG